jgi:S1-C subfamily serine protease
MAIHSLKKLGVFIWILISSSPAFGEIITYTDKEGVIHITDLHSDRPLKTHSRLPVLTPSTLPPQYTPDKGKENNVQTRKSIDMYKKGTIIIKTNNSLGSGFLITPTGHILTNSHVIKENRFVSVQFHDGKIKEAYVVKNIPESDVALIKVPGENLSFLEGRDIIDFKEGEDVIVVGAPQGLHYTVTQGIISSLRKTTINGRSVLFIQTDAPINRGNSGGPLIRKSDGTVIGLITFKSMGVGVEGLGFALAFPEIKKLLNLDSILNQ